MQKADAPENPAEASAPAVALTNPHGQAAHSGPGNLNRSRKGNKVNMGPRGNLGNVKNPQGAPKSVPNNRFQRPNNAGSQNYGERKWEESQNGGSYKVSEVKVH